MNPNALPDFVEVERSQCKASIVIEGLSGAGKSGLALEIAYALASDPSKIHALDTEKQALNLFKGLQMSTGSGVFEKFKKLDLLSQHGFAPSNYIAIRERAISQGTEVFIQDSITHAWTRKGGVLELVEDIKRKNPKMNHWAAWGTDEVADEKELIYEMFRSMDCHVISTIRIKEKFETVQLEGKNTVKSLGEQQLFMPDTKYEPDLVLQALEPGHMDGTPPKALVIKTRYAIFQKDHIYEFTPALLRQLKEYLMEGVDPEILREQQRLELIAAIRATLDSDPSLRSVWPVIKADVGHADTKLDDLPLNDARSLLGRILV